MEHFLSSDILLKITEYLNDIKDYLHLFQINKYVYENILNNKDFILDNQLFCNRITCLNEKLPNYLFNLQNLNISNENSNNNFDLLPKFKFIKYLQINKLPDNFIFTNLPFLEGLAIFNSVLQKETLINVAHTKYFYFSSLNIKDNYLKHLNSPEELIFDNCKGITGECLQYFDKLTSLTDRSSFSESSVVKYIEKLTKLKKLKLITYDLNLNTNFLRNLINLEILDVTLKDVDKEDFKYLTNLKELAISGRDLNLSDEENNYCFDSLINLVKLNVNYITSFTGKCLLNFVNLVKLFIPGSQVKDEYLINLKNMKELNIKYCRNINGTGLQNMINLEILEAGDTNLEDQYLTQLCSLKSLDLYNCKNVTGECLSNLNNLTELKIDRTNIKNDFLLNLTNLKSLSVGSSLVGDEYLFNLNQLQFLNISYCKNITDNLENLINLQTLYASNCFNIKKGLFLLKINKLRILSTVNGYLEIEEKS
ncbi:hypothetical protein ABK040_001793 [Willaertia magna]